MIADSRTASREVETETPGVGVTGGRVPLGYKVLRVLILYFLPLAVLAAGALGAKRLIDTAPKAEQRAPGQQATLVQVQPVSRVSTNARIRVMGSVVSARDIFLQPRVSGEVVKLSPKFVPGGRFSEGEFMLEIDPVDYQLAVERSRSQVAQAEYELKLEQGYRDVAEREWALLDMAKRTIDVDGDLALRKPQLAKANAALRAAEASLREAQLALERTTINAPFNCMVESESIDLGSQVSPQMQVARLVGTDEYWVQASIPVDQLQWMYFPGEEHPGSEATVHQELGAGIQGEWQGRVVRLMSGLERQGRMAQVLVSIPNPLEHDNSRPGGLPLLIDSYVNVTIEGRALESVFSLPRPALREDGTIWIMNDRDALEVRPVEVAWRNRDEVLVRSGIREGERLVVSDLPAPVSGMALALRAPDADVVQASATAPAGHSSGATEVVQSAR